MSLELSLVCRLAGLSITPPAAFVQLPVQMQPFFPYELALCAPDGKIELRYRVVLSRGSGSGDFSAEGESNISPARNDIRMRLATGFSSTLDEGALLDHFVEVLRHLSGRDMSLAVSVLPPGHAQVLFGADWAALCFARMADAEFAAGYDTACVHYLHKDDAADMYIIGLFNEGDGMDSFFDEPPEVWFESGDGRLT